MSSDIRLAYASTDISPHCLIELSIGEYTSYCRQSVIVSNLSRAYDNGPKTFLTKYGNVEFGCNIQDNNVIRMDCYNNSQRIRHLDVSRLKKKYIFILAKKSEIMQIFDNIMVFNSSIEHCEGENNKFRVQDMLYFY